MEVILAADPAFGIFDSFHRDHSYTPLFSRLYIEHAKAYYQGIEFEELSFIVTHNGAPVALFLATAQEMEDGSFTLNAYGLAAMYFEVDTLSPAEKKQLKKVVRAELDRIFAARTIDHLRYVDPLEDGVLSEVGRYLLENGFTPQPYFTQMLNLSETEETLKQGLRKSYKSLINWGKNNLAVKVCTRDNLTYEEFDRFRLLHLDVSGRVTRNLRSWEVQYEQVMNDEAFLVTGELEGELVTGSLFLYNRNSCYYGVSASKRELFDKPISHIILWTGILFAKEIGCRVFEMGEIFYPYHFEAGLKSQKELDIAKFKHGFGGRTRAYLSLS